VVISGINPSSNVFPIGQEERDAGIFTILYSVGFVSKRQQYVSIAWLNDRGIVQGLLIAKSALGSLSDMEPNVI
jgi:hypothetical protein